MKKSTVVIIALLTFIFGFELNNLAISDIQNLKIAKVDVAKVVANSNEVKNLKKEQETKTKELQTWLETARKDVEKQPTDEKKQQTLKKYNSEYVKKQQDINKAYRAKLSAIDKNITAKIAEQAKANNFGVVLTKSSVLFGADDITDLVIKNIN